MPQKAKDYAKWLRDLANACLPIELQKKLVTLQPLTKDEALKYAHVVQLAAQAKSLTKQDNLSAKLDRNTERILRAIRKENEDEKPFDKRSPLERHLIDLAALRWVRRRYLDDVDIPMSECIRHVWKKHGNNTVFKDCEAFANAVRYDLDTFYNLEILLARARSEREI